MKDYYKILGVNPAATAHEIKRSYRALAFKYHPDKNPGNPLAEAHFKEIQEAYAILSNPAKRAKYDDERWLMGMGAKTQYKEAVTPSWLLTICIQLNNSLATMDTHRMSQTALQAYILLILSNSHLGVLQQNNNKEINHKIILEVIKATRKLEVQYMPDIVAQLSTLAATDEDAKLMILNHYNDKKNKEQLARFYPYIVILITLALCVFMYLYASIK